LERVDKLVDAHEGNIVGLQQKDGFLARHRRRR
jgi:hypothetical protein